MQEEFDQMMPLFKYLINRLEGLYLGDTSIDESEKRFICNSLRSLITYFSINQLPLPIEFLKLRRVVENKFICFD